MARGVTDERRGLTIGAIVAILRPLLMVCTKRDWRGVEHIPRSGGFVLVPNHVSEFDPLAVSHLLVDNGRVPRFLGKAEVFAVPLLGQILRSAGQIPVQRSSADAAKAFEAAVVAVREGRCVVIYPEGTLTKDPAGWPMVGRTGAARVALATGAPIVPLAQWGPQLVLAPKSHVLRLFPRKTMHMVAGAPVDLEDLAALPLTNELLHEATDRILDEIARLLGELRGEPAPLARYDPRRAA